MKKTYNDQWKKTYNDHNIKDEQKTASLGVAAVHTCFSSQYNISEQKLQETAQTSQKYYARLDGRFRNLKHILGRKKSWKKYSRLKFSKR